MVPSKGAVNSSCCYHEEGKEWVWGLGVGSWKCSSICAFMCRGWTQVAPSSVLGGMIDGFGGAGQHRPRPAWRGPLSWQMRFGFPTGPAPSGFFFFHPQPWEFPPSQGLTPQKNLCKGIILGGGGCSPISCYIIGTGHLS